MAGWRIAPGSSEQGTERLPADKRLNMRKQCKNKCVGALYQLLPSLMKMFYGFQREIYAKREKRCVCLELHMQSTDKSSNNTKQRQKGSVAERAVVECSVSVCVARRIQPVQTQGHHCGRVVRTAVGTVLVYYEYIAAYI